MQYNIFKKICVELDFLFKIYYNKNDYNNRNGMFFIILFNVKSDLLLERARCSMIVFKIKSDPYKRNIEFQSIEPYTKKSVKISEADNCDLASDEIIHGFFPYNVKRIVDEIYEMKSKPGEQVHIVFEGTDDEYDELMDLCSEDEYKDKIILKPQEHHLNSAKEILPRISSIFQDMQPLIEESVHSSERVAQNRRKFEESVDKQKVPICVIGNYSSGKSTFINALVGKEILPSGDDPVTDCVYKIERSQNANSGDVTFNYHGLPITISINEHSKGFGCKITGAGKSNDELINTIQEKTNEQGDQSVHVRINSILAIIESYKKKQKRMNASSGIDSLISITIPFSKEGVLSQSQCNYVIFDTPGEGSATNLDHTLILEKQMKSLSNGLILFITDNKSLDKVEGKSLCEKLIGMECFDNRFTMVIANRADCAKLPREGFLEEDIEDKINQTVCKTLHSNRIFYVSSIVGLGAKQDETFIDEDYQDVYDKERESYTNPEAKHPKSLYRYNIVPEQIKNRCLEWSKAETNKAFANSGLFWIEEEIREFAETYSPYNKCTQSKRFLDEIILETNKRIDESQVNFEASKQTLNEKLMVEEKECVTLLENSAQVLCATYAQNYPTSEMETIKQNSLLSISEGVLRQRQTELETNSKNAHNYAELEADAKLFKNEEATQGENQQQSITNNDIFSSVFKAGQQFVQQTKDSFEKKQQLRELKKQIDAEVSSILFEEVKANFNRQIQEHQVVLDDNSKQYWLEKSNDFREKMINTVTNSKGISEDKKTELESIIANYDALEFEKDVNTVFNFAELKRYFFKLGDFTLGETNNLNLSKLRIKYNSSMQSSITEMIESLRTSHEGSFVKWEQELLNALIENIVKLNPDLRALQEQIDAQVQQINNLKNRKKRLLDYQLEIENLMSWN